MPKWNGLATTESEFENSGEKYEYLYKAGIIGVYTFGRSGFGTKRRLIIFVIYGVCPMVFPQRNLHSPWQSGQGD